MTDPATPGRFLVVEGLDGAGTTTQVARLVERLRAAGVEAESHKEPTDGPFGRAVRDFTDGRVDLDPGTVALGFAADRLEHVRQIRGLLAVGTWVVSDRYVPSSLAYQTSQGLDFEWVRTLNSHAMAPDATVFVDTAVDVCVARLTARGEFNTGPFDRADALHAARDLYLRAFASDAPVGRLLTVDGDGAADDVADAIWDALGDLRP